MKTEEEKKENKLRLVERVADGRSDVAISFRSERGELALAWHSVLKRLSHQAGHSCHLILLGINISPDHDFGIG